MFRIHKREKEAFAAAEERAFENRAVAMLRKSWATRFAAEGEERVRAFVKTWANIATERGFTDDREAAHLVNIAFAITHDFREDPLRVGWFDKVTSDAGLGQEAKIYRLYGSLYAAYDALEREPPAEER